MHSVFDLSLTGKVRTSLSLSLSFLQACILRVDVYRCSECSEKVKKRLQKIKGKNSIRFASSYALFDYITRIDEISDFVHSFVAQE